MYHLHIYIKKHERNARAFFVYSFFETREKYALAVNL